MMLVEHGRNAEQAHGHAKAWQWKCSLGLSDSSVTDSDMLCKRVQAALAREREQAGGGSAGVQLHVLCEGHRGCKRTQAALAREREHAGIGSVSAKV